MAHKKGAGSSNNGRESESKRLGVKIFGGQLAIAGNIIVREASKAISSIESANQKSEVIDLLDPYLTKLDQKDLIKITNSNDIHRDLIEHLEDSNFRIEIIAKLDKHILQSMVKRYIHDA